MAFLSEKLGAIFVRSRMPDRFPQDAAKLPEYNDFDMVRGYTIIKIPLSNKDI